MRNLNSLPTRELLERVRQVLGLGHDRAIDQHRNDRHVALERRFDLDAHEIIGVVEATAIVLVRAGEPIPANHRDERVAAANALGQDFHEIATGRDIVDVNEDTFRSEASLQAIINAPREACRVFPTVADEDAAPHAMPPLLEKD